MSRKPLSPDARAEFDPLLAAADRSTSPWRYDAEEGTSHYIPDVDLLHQLLAIPIEQGYANKQQSGRVAKALDAYLAHELRRAGFDPREVFPRDRQPRVLSKEVAPIESALDDLDAAIDAAGLSSASPVARKATAVRKALPGTDATRILGRFYVKEVDVAVSSWQTGPLVLISGKTQFSSYLNNKNNRYEEAIGEATNLRDRYPMTAMGYAFLARENVADNDAYILIRDLLARLRKPDGPFDATLLLVASWEDDPLALMRVADPTPELGLARFFEDLLDAFTRYTPVGVRPDVLAKMVPSPLDAGI